MKFKYRKVSEVRKKAREFIREKLNENNTLSDYNLLAKLNKAEVEDSKEQEIW